jgi:hypothetical protein
LPRPAGAGKEDGSPEIDAVVGEQPMKTQGLMTTLGVEAARAFYLEQLPKQGWRVGPMPGMDQVRAQRKNAEKTFRDHQADIAADPKLKAQVAMYDPAGLDHTLERVIYAERGRERLMVVFNELGPRKTMVMLNRYDEARAVDRVGDGLPPPRSTTSVCCSGGQVPSALRMMPEGIPSYPKARPMATGAVPQMAPSQKMISEMALTEDSAHEVAAFYRTRMAAAGWAMEDRGDDIRRLGFSLNPLPGGGPMDAKLLVFRKDGAICTIAMGKMPRSALTESAPAAPAAPASSAPQAKEKREETIIMLTYLETKSLKKREAGHGLPFAAPAQR